jgi:hypothetical protein
MQIVSKSFIFILEFTFSLYFKKDFISENGLPFTEELLKKGGMFIKNHDKKGVPIRNIF